MADMIRLRFCDYEDEKKEILLKHLEQAARHMLSLVDDFLDISVIESGSLRLSRQKNSLKELVGECVSLGDYSSKKKNIQIHLEISDIPGFDFDFEKIVQVVNNLYSNAVKYSPLGTDVHISIWAEDNRAWLSVKDRGREFLWRKSRISFRSFSV